MAAAGTIGIQPNAMSHSTAAVSGPKPRARETARCLREICKGRVPK